MQEEIIALAASQQLWNKGKGRRREGGGGERKGRGEIREERNGNESGRGNRENKCKNLLV